MPALPKPTTPKKSASNSLWERFIRWREQAWWLVGVACWISMAVGTGTAHAQVVRCTDPATGALTYTDGSCAQGQRAATITPARTAEERAREEARSQAARARWQQEEELHQQQRQAEIASEPPPPPPVPPTQHPACLAAQQELQALTLSGTASPSAIAASQRSMELQCLSPQTYEALERNRAHTPEPTVVPIYISPPVTPHPHPRPPAAKPIPMRPPTTPIQQLNCTSHGCFDERGNRLPR